MARSVIDTNAVDLDVYGKVVLDDAQLEELVLSGQHMGGAGECKPAPTVNFGCMTLNAIACGGESDNSLNTYYCSGQQQQN